MSLALSVAFKVSSESGRRGVKTRMGACAQAFAMTGIDKKDQTNNKKASTDLGITIKHV